ncbi:MAG TPA: M20/M25/M40 family metallo-hydrolase [Patescibacteria group bacterium]|nr:M20/M25/M40 family metallo-hydrolase [Patescibacteria group bacterium]
MKLNVTTITKQLIAFQTTHDHPQEIMGCLRWIEKIFAVNGVQAQWFKHPTAPSMLLLPKSCKRPKILLLGHIDVVPSVSQKQYRSITRSGKLYGRGAFDMKGPLAALLSGFLQGTKMNLPIGILITSDEEAGGFQGAGKFIQNKHLLPSLVINPDGGNDFTVVSGGKGVANLEVIVRGKSAHSSRPWEGENAILRAVQLVSQIQSKYAGASEKETKETTLVPVSLLSQTHAHNVVPHHVTLRYNIRYTQDFDFNKFRKTITSVPGASLAIAKETTPYDSHLEAPLSLSFLTTMKTALGRSIQTKFYPSTTDARFFAQKNIPVIVTRPKGGGAHGPDEWIDIKSLEKFERVLKTFLQKTTFKN